MKEAPRGGLDRSARLSIFVNVVLICLLGAVLAFAVIWLCGRLAWKYDLRLDLSGDERFTIDPLAVSILRDLKEPVHVTFVYGIDDELKQRALDLARRPRADVLTTLKAMTGQDFKDTASAKAWAESNRTAGWDW